MQNHPKPSHRHPRFSSNIITHQLVPNFSTILPNPQDPPLLFSARKTIPKNSEVIRQRSEMIVHPSKLSKDVPGWFKGETYKYYNRSQYNQINLKNISRTIDNGRSLIGTIQPNYNRSECSSTPKSRRSNEADIFYFGGRQNQPYIRRVSLKKQQRQIAGKIGSVDFRNFELPKIQMKIGREEYINTQRPF